MVHHSFFQNQPPTEEHSLDNNPYNKISLEIPNYCEFEGVPTYFSFLGALDSETINNHRHFGVGYSCPSCHHYIVIDYELHDFSTATVIHYDYDFLNVNYPFSKTISDLSPRFEKIYCQTSIAESTGLDELTGFGYRKALEFLIKDFLIKTDESNSDKVKGSMLNNCINMLPDEDLKNTSKISAWIGNDSTHYIQKNPDLGLEDLKNYLEVTAQYIDFKIKSKNAGIYIDKHQGKKH